MQSWSESTDHNTLHHHFNKVILYILICFSLAGLVSGFAIGGFTVHHTTKPIAHSNPPATPRAISTPTAVVTATATPEKVELGYPLIKAGDYTPVEQADGATTYTLSALIVNKTTGTPIQAKDVTCRLWLTKSTKATQTALSANGYALPKAISSFHQTFPAEAAGALNFASSTQQVQNCVANGKTSWTYTIAPTVKHGFYYLATIADWQGKHYNWYMLAISIR